MSAPTQPATTTPPPETNSAPVRVICFFRKRADLTDAQFYHHWEHVHGPLLAPWVVKHGIDSYTQIHTTSPLRTQWSHLLTPPLPSSLPTLPYQGYAEMEFSSAQKMRNAFLDPYYGEVIARDEERFLDKSQGDYGEEGGAMSTMGRVVRVVEGGVRVQKGVGDGGGEEGGKVMVRGLER